MFTATAVKTDPVCQGSATGIIKATVTGGTLPYQYRNGSITTVYQTDSVFRNLAAGTYRIYFKDAKGFTGYTNAVTLTNPATPCSPTFITKASQVAIKEVAAKPLEVLLSPNPSSTSFKILAHGKADKAVHVRVLDMNGRVVYAAEGATEQSFKFGQRFTSGMYLVEVRQGEEVKTRKAVKMK